jgi:hypothetical protein
MCRAWEEHTREAKAFLCEPFSSRCNVYLVRFNILDPALLIFHSIRGQIPQYFLPHHLDLSQLCYAQNSGEVVYILIITQHAT